MLIIGMAGASAISGAASIAWAAPPELDPISHLDVFRAVSALGTLDPCRQFSLSITASEIQGNFVDPGNSGIAASDDIVFVRLIFRDLPTGTLFFGEVFAFEQFTVNMHSASVSSEFIVDRIQCDPDPTCSAFTNCVFVGEDVLLVDLDWTGIGVPELTHTVSTVHLENGTVQHEHLHTTLRDASVSGVVSVGEFDIEIEDEFGRLLRENREAVFSDD